ncbi:MAG: lipoyl synthase [Candidatus Omnitrophota bacterium]
MKKPHWLRRSLSASGEIESTRRALRKFSVNTVCETANCPNLCECFQKKTATFMILGTVCTRGCRFCSVEMGIPGSVELDEPLKICEAVRELGLRHVVITSVTRDDLTDGGAAHYANVARYLRQTLNYVIIETLVPDFKGDSESLELVCKSGINIFAHNIDTVPRLFNLVKPRADYERSIEVLNKAKLITRDISTKTGLMLGLGETENEIFITMKKLRAVDCEIITIGQYLRPAEGRLKEREFISPKIFEKYEEIAYNLGFKRVKSGPFVRSSYNVC